MLCSSFEKDNDSVTVDILSFTDLEMKKAQKRGGSGVAVRSTAAAPSANTHDLKKRYVILTYMSEFDKAHYPLPLKFEDEPNYPALRRTIARLRRKIAERENREREPATEKERYDGFFVYE